MSRLALTLLGGFQVQAGTARPLTVPTKKAQALLAYLALTPGQTQPRDKLTALLWADVPHGSARNALRQTLFVLRKALGPAQDTTLLVGGGGITLPVDAVQTDVAAFEQAVADGTPVALEAAVGLYRGDLLAGLTVVAPTFEDWLMSERERLRERAVEAHARLLAHQRAVGATASAVQSALRLLALDPLQEAVHRTLMRLHAQLGRRDAALRQYQECVDVLRRELAVEPEADTKELYQEILRQRPLRAATTPSVTGPAEAPLVGRDGEVTQLHEALAEAWAGQGRVLAVLGEAGIGKSRLLAELAAEAGRRGGAILLGRAYETEQILPFGPWVSALRDAGVVTDSHVLEGVGSEWRAELARLFPELADPGRSVASNPGDQMRLFEALAQLLRRLAVAQPLLVLLEDGHWADDMTLRFLAFLGRRLHSAPILLALSIRDEELPDHPLLRRTLDELDADRRLVCVSLGRLEREPTTTLVRLLGRADSHATALAQRGEQVWRASGGNPFIVVETMRAIGCGGVALEPSDSLPLPTNVRDMIARRLERLSEQARQLLRVAAVIGREFEFTLLQRAAGVDEPAAAEGLEELVRRRVVHGVGDRFDFTHERIRDVVAAELLPPRRQWLHARVLDAIETLYQGRLGEHVERLAQHAVRAEQRDKAVHYLRQAGLQATARSALEAARVWFEQALTLLGALPESEPALEESFEIRLELWPVLSVFGEVRPALERLHEAEALAERLNDERRRGRVCAFIASGHSLLGELGEALAFGARALAIARELGDLRLRILATSYLEQAHYFRGEYERVVELATDNLAALPADWVHESFGLPGPASVLDRIWLVMSLAQLGRFAEAAEHEGEALRLAEPTRHGYTVGWAHLGAGMLHTLKGDWLTARSLIEHGIALLRAGNVAILLPFAAALSARVLAQLGERRDALDRLQEAEQLLERQTASGIVVGRNAASYMLGHACLLLDRLDEARSLGERAVESPSHPYTTHARHLLGDIAAHPDRFDAERSEAHYREALALAERRSLRPLVAHCHLGLGRLYRRTGKREQAQEHLDTATTLYREMDMRFWLEHAESEVKQRA
jgi:DNA-binding SARP family transcriptional activator